MKSTQALAIGVSASPPSRRSANTRAEFSRAAGELAQFQIRANWRDQSASHLSSFLPESFSAPAAVYRRRIGGSAACATEPKWQMPKARPAAGRSAVKRPGLPPAHSVLTLASIFVADLAVPPRSAHGARPSSPPRHTPRPPPEAVLAASVSVFELSPARRLKPGSPHRPRIVAPASVRGRAPGKRVMVHQMGKRKFRVGPSPGSIIVFGGCTLQRKATSDIPSLPPPIDLPDDNRALGIIQHAPNQSAHTAQ